MDKYGAVTCGSCHSDDIFLLSEDLVKSAEARDSEEIKEMAKTADMQSSACKYRCRTCGSIFTIVR